MVYTHSGGCNEVFAMWRMHTACFPIRRPARYIARTQLVSKRFQEFVPADPFFLEFQQLTCQRFALRRVHEAVDGAAIYDSLEESMKDMLKSTPASFNVRLHVQIDAVIGDDRCVIGV